MVKRLLSDIDLRRAKYIPVRPDTHGKAMLKGIVLCDVTFGISRLVSWTCKSIGTPDVLGHDNK